MRIATTHENGNIFQHFGRTESFKVYEIDENKNIVSSQVIGSNGAGHGALAGVLAENGIDVLICGGIGGGAQAALAEAGVELCAGADGDCDEAVAAFLRGELVNTGSNCDHHGEGHVCGDHADGHSCGHHEEAPVEEPEEAFEEEWPEEGGCSGSCGSCGGGCGGFAPQFDGPNVGRICKVHYTGTFNDGSKFDSSYDRGEPLEFVCGGGMMILGFDKAVATMEVGQVIDIHLMPEEAYGPKDPTAIISLAIENLPGCEDLNVGEKVYLTNNMGQQFLVTVVEKDAENITFDANHEMAGKELNFKIELVEVQ